MADLALTAAALSLEAAFGYPDALDRRLPHPVNLQGRAIAGLEARWNRPAQTRLAGRFKGAAAVGLVCGASVGVGWALSWVLRGRSSRAALALLATVGLAQRSLYLHVAAVDAALAGGDLPTARRAVGRIVGRDTDGLDPSGVAAAALESLAESFNDGVVAPAFWLALAGLPGLFAYKAVNTADSLVGHREVRWRDFGWAAARLDDLMNLVPARLAGGLLALAGGRGWAIMRRDARRHASPNAGWPEAAMAGALRVRLGGPARYDGAAHPRPSFGDGPSPAPRDLRRGLRLYVRACMLLSGGFVLGAIAWRR